MQDCDVKQRYESQWERAYLAVVLLSECSDQLLSVSKSVTVIAQWSKVDTVVAHAEKQESETDCIAKSMYKERFVARAECRSQRSEHRLGAVESDSVRAIQTKRYL